MFLPVHANSPFLIMQTRKWPADCKVERCEKSNQIAVLLSLAMNVHSEERHPRQEEGRREEEGGLEHEREGRRGSTVTRGRLTIADKTSDVGELERLTAFAITPR